MTAPSVDAALRARERGMHLIDYLRSRGYVQDISDETGLREASIERSGHRLHRLRPDRGLAPRRPPAQHHGARHAPALRAPADRARRRRHDHGRRPDRQDRDPQGADAGGDPGQPRRTSSSSSTATSTSRAAASAITARPRCWSTTPTGCSSSTTSSSCAISAATSRSTRCWPPRPTSSGSRRPDSTSSSSTTGSSRRTTSCTSTAPSGCRLQMGGSDQWGNIVAGRRSDPPRRGRSGLRAGHAADHHGLRPEDGQERRQLALARSGDDHARSTTTSTGSTPTTPMCGS